MIDVEIYIKNFINFFENNPNDLSDLIGEDFKEVFFNEVRKQCEINYETGDDVTLTQQQIIDIVVKIKGGKKKTKEIFEKNKFGEFCLN